MFFAGLVLAAGSYWSGLTGPFLFDDHGNFLRNQAVKMNHLDWEGINEAAYSANMGGRSVHRPLARVSFALNYYFSGGSFDEFSMKLTNLVIHLLNGTLLAILMALFLRCLRCGVAARPALLPPAARAWLAVIVALVWVLHPLHLTSVLYAVQRMTSMSGTGVLIGCVAFTYGRLLLADGRSYAVLIMVVGVLVGTLIGVASKESAVLTPLFAILIEAFLFERTSLSHEQRVRLIRLYVVVVSLFVCIAVTVALLRFDVLISFYDARNFSAWERLITQPRALGLYLGLLAFPNVRHFGLFHDDLVLSQGLLQPWTTLLAIVVLLGAVVIAARQIGKRSVLSFGILWFLVGHSIESSFVGLELSHEHRNYIPSIGPVFAVCYYVALGLAKVKSAAVAPVLTVACIALLAFVTHTRASVWAARQDIMNFSVRNHPQSYRSQMGLGALFQMKNGNIMEIYNAYQRAAVLNEFTMLPLARMQRIVSGLLNQIEAGTLSEDLHESVDVERVDFRSPMIVTREYLQRLDKNLADEISHRIATYAFDAESTLALDELRQCVGSHFGTCPPASTVEAWVDIGLQREHLMRNQRLSLLLTKARLRAYAGDESAAVEHMELAIDEATDKVSTTLELVLMYLDFGRIDDAKVSHARGAKLAEASGRRISEFHQLQQIIDDTSKVAQEAVSSE
jgi:hypothetical protein